MLDLLARRVLRVSAFAAVLALSVAGPSAQELAPAALHERVRALVDAARVAAGIPGLSVAMRVPHQGFVAVGSGLADLENEVAVTERSVFRLASISKPVTAVIALRLAARSTLDLDRDVRELVPQFPDKGHPITTRQLLGHLGGIRHYRGDEIASNRRYARVADTLAIFADDPLVAAPGVQHHYSTYGYSLAGAAIVAAAGAEFDVLLRREICEPAACETLTIDDAERIVPHRVQGYVRRGERLANSRPVDVTNKVPGGGLCGTPTDLVRFGAALLDGVLLDPESLELAWTSQSTSDGKATGYGCGFRVETLAGRRIVSHGGAQPRVSTLLWIDRDRGVVIALMANLEGAARALRELALALAS
ncbi:MAG: beta-lactamase family protein [Planctomycetes bacterium]|nr:beta-lactamase family protein [Planctomycetota bacterium]